jgi:hypothetical protein
MKSQAASLQHHVNQTCLSLPELIAKFVQNGTSIDDALIKKATQR